MLALLPPQTARKPSSADANAAVDEHGESLWDVLVRAPEAFDDKRELKQQLGNTRLPDFKHRPTGKALWCARARYSCVHVRAMLGLLAGAGSGGACLLHAFMSVLRGAHLAAGTLHVAACVHLCSVCRVPEWQHCNTFTMVSLTL